MKRQELERLLRELGWRFSRHGGAHDLWTDGVFRLAIPRHVDIARGLARSLIKKASSKVRRENEV